MFEFIAYSSFDVLHKEFGAALICVAIHMYIYHCLANNVKSILIEFYDIYLINNESCQASGLISNACITPLHQWYFFVDRIDLIFLFRRVNIAKQKIASSLYNTGFLVILFVTISWPNYREKIYVYISPPG